jgi:hypothetical protein
MFENPVETEKSVEKSRGRAILWMGTAVVLALTALIVLFAKSRPHAAAALEGGARAGNAEFDAYKGKVEIEITDKVVHPNMIGMFQIDIKARIHNRGERPIAGLEIVGKMIALDDKVLSQRVSIPIPGGRPDPLKPGESIPVSVKVDAPGKITEDDVKDVVIELSALRYQ